MRRAAEIKLRNGMQRLSPEENRLAGFPDPAEVKHQEKEKKAAVDFIAKNLSGDWKSTTAFAREAGVKNARILKQLKIMEKAGAVFSKAGRFEDRPTLFWRAK